MGGKTSQQSTSTTTQMLPGMQQTNVDLLMQGARDYFNSGGAKYYGGNTVAGPADQQLQARQNAQGYATGVGQNLVDQAQANDRFWLNPQNVFNPANIPGFQAAQDGVTRQVTRNLTENILPQIRQGSVATGSLGGSRQGLGEALAVDNTNKTLADTLGNMNMQAWNTGLNQANSAAARAPQTYGLGLNPAETLSRVGGEYQSDEQKMIDAAMTRFNFDQLAPLLNLQALQGLTGTMGQYGGTTTTNTEQKMSGGSGLGQLVGGGLSLLSMMYPPAGAAAGAAGLLGGK